MKLNIAYPATGCQKLLEVEDEKKYRIFYDKRMAQEVEADALGEEWKVITGFLKRCLIIYDSGLHLAYHRWKRQTRIPNEARCFDQRSCSFVARQRSLLLPPTQKG